MSLTITNIDYKYRFEVLSDYVIITLHKERGIKVNYTRTS